MSTQRHEDVNESLAAYALGALEGEERAEVEAHVASCVQCQRELLAYQQSAAALGGAFPAVTPPPALRQRVLERAFGPHGDALSRDGSPARRPAWAFHLWPAAAAVLALLFLGVLALQVALLARLGQLQEQNTALARQVDELMAQSTVMAENLRMQRGLVYLSAAPGTTVVSLAGRTVPDAYGMLMVSASGTSGYLVAANLEPLPPDRAYQAWFIDDTGPSSRGVFRPDPTGWGVIWLDPTEDGPWTRFTAVGVTVEPSEGSPEPTGPMVLWGSLQ